MKKFGHFMMACLLSLGVFATQPATSIYGYEATDIQGKSTILETYKGKVVLIVNTASKCGLTPQYAGLEKLYQEYKDKDFVILGFPCNQFLKQEPGTDEEIADFCSINYGVSFPMFSKIEVNGDNTHPLYVYLKNELPSSGNKSDIEWNFAKFLIDREGKPVKRFSPRTKPEDLKQEIEEIL